ncbi:DDHD domain-containing protein [Xylariomycetidae sp. FL0641]|nr:DDHD domain-containing protein [Xylariomycetidae sp. FL0641]
MSSVSDGSEASGDKKGEKKIEKKAEKSYLASAVDSINPWNSSRSNTPPTAANTNAASTAISKDAPTLPKPAPAPTMKAEDHSTNTLYGKSFKTYPPDCPPLNVMWFHAVDVPKRKPNFLKTKKEAQSTKAPIPKKYSPFSKGDSRSIESAYQKLLEELENERGGGPVNKQIRSRSQRRRAVSDEQAPNTSIDKDESSRYGGLRIPVNEDFLFDVDIEERELAPVYWLGPVYEVRRGTWFYQEGSTLRPCEENLAAQLEEGYLKIKPWTYPTSRVPSRSGMRDVTPKASAENLKATAKTQAEAGSLKPPPTPTGPQHQPQTHRLFGTYMNSIVTYQDPTTAWLSSESVFSWVTSTVYQKFAGGGYMNGVKLVRGYTEPGKTKDGKRPATPTTPTTAALPPRSTDEKTDKALKRRSAPPSTRSDTTPESEPKQASDTAEQRESQLQRQFPSYIDATDPDGQEEEIRKREEQEIQDDYTGQDGETQGREIEHLVLVTHGIGQLLGLRMESVNFVHDVNLLRKTIKGVYAHSADLKALNSEKEEGPGNCKIQVLPVCWRHLLDFPKRREKKGETDLGDVVDDEDEYPSLEDITIEGVAFARSLISDLALDVLLYQSAYREQISEIVQKESNRIYKLFLERNPNFRGKVHIVGHSLGSAIMFDILCRQKEPPKVPESLRNPLRFWPSERSEPQKDAHDLAFDFEVDDLYCLGSPIGLFQMLKGRTIGARHQPHSAPSESPLSSDYMEDPFRSSSLAPDQHVSAITGLPFSVSSPRVAQLFNVFHPSDPISYRLEPLISPAMSSLKPQVLPYTKKGIFGTVAPQGLSGIGVKVGQSVSGLWSSFSGSIASNLLNRSLGLTNEDVASFNANNPSAPPAPGAPNPAQQGTLAPAAGTNIVAGGVVPDAAADARSEKSDARKRALARQASSTAASGSSTPRAGDNNATLIDDELETLYARFQKKRVEEGDAAHHPDGAAAREAWAAEELKAQKLRREELKVRALNWNGRVDYSIQEGSLDFNPISTLASHMSYWQDEDVSHFIISQLLAQRAGRARAGKRAQALAASSAVGRV